MLLMMLRVAGIAWRVGGLHDTPRRVRQNIAANDLELTAEEGLARIADIALTGGQSGRGEPSRRR